MKTVTKVMQCTVFKIGKRSRKARAVVRELQDVVDGLRLSLEKNVVVSAFRQDVASLSPGERWPLIDELPLVCPGMVIRKHRNGEETSAYTGVALLQIKDL